jgi:hypothetical protein
MYADESACHASIAAQNKLEPRRSRAISLRFNIENDKSVQIPALNDAFRTQTSLIGSDIADGTLVAVCYIFTRVDVFPRLSNPMKSPATKAPASMPSGLRLVIASSSEATVVTCCEADLAMSPAAALALPTAAWPRSTASPTVVFTVSVIASTC